MIRLVALLTLILSLPLLAADKKPSTKPKKEKAPEMPAVPSPWGEFVEQDFPFFSSVLDARDVGEDFPKDNLTPRGLILNLGHNLWACFDTDLLRVACIWEGEPGKPPVTPVALAPGSYHIAGQKTKDGQDFLPKPVGKVWLANGIYPGWQVGEKPTLSDPREAGPSKEEVGRGALTAPRAQLKAIRFVGNATVIDLEIAGAQVSQAISFRHLQGPGIDLYQHFRIANETTPLNWIYGIQTSANDRKLSARNRKDRDLFAPTGPLIQRFKTTNANQKKLETETKNKMTVTAKWEWSVSGKHDLNFALKTAIPKNIQASPAADDVISKLLDPEKSAELPSSPRWPQTLTTQASLSKSQEAYVIDDIALPTDNPWKRNVRLADLAFLNDQGDAAAVSFDGDVWLISGLKGDLEKVTWKRFTSGLHEPMSIVWRPEAEDGTESKSPPPLSPLPSSGAAIPPRGALFVFDRNGIWKLIDTNNDGEADVHEMFCNLFAQTAETREFPNSMKLGPDGSLYISKGGQEGTTYGKHNGTVIKVAPDGKNFDVIGYGLRQPFIGVHPKTGLVTASDQQGHYVPSTPLHIIKDRHYYGHLPTIAPKEQYPEAITDPLTWVPHPVNPSGVTQTWLVGAKMGPLNDELIHIGYNRPELFRVLMNPRFQKPQAAVVSFSRDFDFPTLNAKVNPADGQLYVIGFQVWGTTVKRISGLARVRYTGKPRVLLQEVTPTDKGLLLRFNAKLDAKLASDPANYNAERWNYKRTPEYGSPHLKLDGSTGQEWMTASSAYLSKDGQSVLVGFPDMRTVNQMRVGWGLKSETGLKAENAAYFTPWELAKFDAVKEGFGDIQIDLTPRKAAAVATVQPTVEEGARLYQMFGCMACHSTDGTTEGKVGPSWKGLFGTDRDIAKGAKGTFKADETYLRESILNPSAKVVKGFEKFDTGMPIYAGILNDSQIDSLVLFIKSLK